MRIRVGLLVAGGLTLLFLSACGDGDSPSLLARRLEASLDVTAKVTYETTEIREETGNPDPPSLTITQGRWGRRVDSYASPEGNTYSGTLLDLRDEQYVCNRYTGAKELTLPYGVTLTEDELETIEEGFCLLSKDDYSSWKQRTEVAPLFYFTSSIRQVYEDYDEQLEWEIAPSRTIAGNGADCYRHTLTEPETGEGVAGICFSADDILLSMEVRSDGAGFVFLAREVDRDVDEHDFALPYPIFDWR